jgi:hypothetical protein
MFGRMSMSQQGASRARRVVSRPLAELVNRALDPLIARRGFGEATLLTQWDMIVGARIGALCQPMRLNWPPRPKNGAPDAGQQPATLALRVEPGFGLDIQHMSGAIVERVNTHLGWRCVAKLAIRQEPLHRAAPKRPRTPPSDPAARARAEETTQGVENDALRAALITLGERVLAEKASG